MEGVGECVAFDLNVKDTALKTSEDSSSLRKEQTPGLRGWTETGRMQGQKDGWGGQSVSWMLVTFIVKNKTKGGAEVGGNVMSCICL